MKKILLVLIIISLSLLACSAENKGDVSSQYNLGIKYVNEGNYEEAILAFEEAINIEPKNSDLYLNIADILIRKNLFEEAETILERGYKETKSKEIKEKLDEFKSGIIKDNTGQIRKESAYDTSQNLIWYRVYNVEFDHGSQDGEIISYNHLGEETSRCLLGYKENNYSVSYACGYDDNTGELIQMIYHIGENQRIEKTEWLDKQGNVTQYDLFIDIDANTRRVETYSFGKLHYYTVFETSGNTTKQTRYDAEDNVTSMFIIVTEDDKITYSTYDSEGKLNGKHIRIIDENGDITEYYDADGNLLQTIKDN
ncbi:tetratricopeptide repeat protein [Holdemania massiliensis]|uniref:tetratricopeptide repeat protein n=1 Tax=Holdemania massiliensis TaxID=1468449 RepID=UPI00031FE8F4|nr:tetratricopeptide repeat protein [Holdemania massiliensis]